MSAFQEAVEAARTVRWERAALMPLPSHENDLVIGTEAWRRRVAAGVRAQRPRPGFTRRPELDGCKSRKEYRRRYMRLRRAEK